MNPLTATILIGLASYRLWRLVALDDLLNRPRWWLPWWLVVWLRCPWCTTVWYAAGVTALTAQVVGVAVPVLVWAGSATVAAWIAVADRRLHAPDDGA